MIMMSDGYAGYRARNMEPRVSNSSQLFWLFVGLLFIALLTSTTDGTLSQSDRGNKKTKDSTQLSAKTVVERGLVVENPKFKDVLKEHKYYCDLEREVKHFQGQVLAYVTPWNSHGYDIAKIFGHKFSFVSPVWMQIKRKGSGYYFMQGGHDIDKSWVKDVTKGRSVQMLPRVLFDGWTARDYQALFSSEDEMEDCIDVFVKLVKQHRFHGVVLEVWSQLGGQNKRELTHFLQHLGEALREEDGKLILVLPPPPLNQGNTMKLVTKEDIDAISPYVDAFSLMTYDYSNPMSPGPNSPYDWVRACVELLAPEPNSVSRSKILLGINFYGNDYSSGGGSAIVGNQYLEILSKYKPKFQWNKSFKEHSFQYRTGLGDHTVYYPSLLSVSERISLAKQLGTGIAIWEIGQGLDYFYDLL